MSKATIGTPVQFHTRGAPSEAHHKKSPLAGTIICIRAQDGSQCDLIVFDRIGESQPHQNVQFFESIAEGIASGRYSWCAPVCATAPETGADQAGAVLQAEKPS
jgi:hypothetical protein